MMLLWIPTGHGPYNTARPRPLNFCRFAKLQNANDMNGSQVSVSKETVRRFLDKVACNTKNHLGHFPPNNLVLIVYS